MTIIPSLSALSLVFIIIIMILKHTWQWDGRKSQRLLLQSLLQLRLRSGLSLPTPSWWRRSTWRGCSWSWCLSPFCAEPPKEPNRGGVDSGPDWELEWNNFGWFSHLQNIGSQGGKEFWEILKSREHEFSIFSVKEEKFEQGFSTKAPALGVTASR